MQLYYNNLFIIILYFAFLYYIIFYYNLLYNIFILKWKSFPKWFTLIELRGTKRPKLSNKVWISLREIPAYFKKVVWLANLQAFNKELNTIQKRIIHLIKFSGFQFTFQYLKNANHYVVMFLSGNPVTSDTYLKGPYISIDSTGLPMILPVNIRIFLQSSREGSLSANSKIIGGILTLLSIFRVFPTHVSEKYSTIVDPFNGIGRSFDLSKISSAWLDLTSNIRLRSRLVVKLIGGESAGPNGFKAVWLAGVDALAFIHNRKVWWCIIKWLYIHSKPFLLWFILIQFIGFLPYVTLMLINRDLLPLQIGKLGVVYNTAGKARVVAMTNWWIQLCFKPLHNNLFEIVKQIDCDGTFDQDKALEEFILRADSSQKFHSFDLSAATDRLPIDIQRDILSLLIPSANIWSDIIRNIDWIKPGVRDWVRYSVGQPMGAYSSWAMLAITHHVVVRIASIQAGFKNFKGYVVLGDDIVINNDIVASNYLDLMRYLGLEINLSKSIISNDFCEFAKRLRGPSIEITPMGPGLILRFVRDVFYIGNVIREGAKLKWFSSTNDFLIPMMEAYPKKSKLLSFVLWVCLGYGGAFEARPIETDHPALDGMVSIYIGRFISPDNIEVLHMVKLAIGNALLRAIRRDLHKRDLELSKAEEYFYLNWYDTFVSIDAPIRILELILLLVNPGLWYLAENLIKARSILDQKFSVLNKGFESWRDIYNLISLDEDLTLVNIDWRQRKAVKDYSKRVESLLSDIHKEFDHLQFLREENRKMLKLNKRRNSFDILSSYKPKIRVAVY